MFRRAKHTCWLVTLLLFAIVVPGHVTADSAQDKPETPGKITDKELEGLWNDLAGDDAEKAFRAIWQMVGAGKEAVVFMQVRLRPVILADAEQYERIRQLIKDLDSRQFSVRSKAMAELLKVGETAVPALRQALKSGKITLEVQRRIEELLGTLDGVTPRGKTLQALHAVEVLEYIASPEARQLLVELAKGAPDARITQSAQGSLQRLARRPP